MARARNIKPGFFKNEALAELGFDRRLLFIGLWTLADREGRLEDRPKRIRMEIFPGDSVEVERALTDLAEAGFITRYEVGGARYIQVLAFLKHQNPHHREPSSTIPKPGASPHVEALSSPGLSVDAKPPKPGASLGPAEEKPGRAVLIPDSGFSDSLIPDSPSRIPDSGFSDPGEKQPRSARASRPPTPKTRLNGHNPKTASTWEAYSSAYLARYGTEPVRNATVNAQLAAFVKRIGSEEAPPVAAFYVTHGKAYYVGKKHSVGALLADAEGLRTEWATGRQVTETQARQTDRTATTGAIFEKLIAEAK